MAGPKKNNVPTEAILSIARLIVEPTLNVRMRKGSEVYGIVISQDGYDLPTMIAQIVERGKILEPIHVSERSDGKLIVLRGNRRTLAGQHLLNAPDTTQEMLKELNATRVLVFRNLTAEEEREKVMDQNSKPFSRSEIVRYAWSLRQNGQSFERIAVDNFEMWGQFGRNARTTQKMIDIRAIPENDIETRRKAIKVWLRGTVDEYVLPCFDLGPIIQKACLLSELKLDGLLKDSDEQPRFYTTRNPQTRLKELGAAKVKDGSKWSSHLGGEEFNKLVEKFHLEDFPPAGSGTPVADKTKRPSVADLKIRMNAAKSSPARMAFSIAAGGKEDDFVTRDDTVSLMEAKETLFLQFAENIKPDVTVNLRDVLTQIFLRDNIIDFKTMLELHCPNLATVKTVDNDTKSNSADATAEDDDSDGEDTNEDTTANVDSDGTFPLA